MAKVKYVVNRRMGGRVGTASSIVGAKKLIKRDGQLLTRYSIIRVSGTGKERTVGTYQNKLSGAFGRKLVTVKVRG